MKTTLIANISANGQILLAENPKHTPPRDAIAFYVAKAVEAGNFIIGRRTFDIIENFPGGIAKTLPGVAVVILSATPATQGKFPVRSSVSEAFDLLSSQGFEQAIVGGGTSVYNAFLESGLVDEIYLNIIPLVTGSGHTFGNEQDLFAVYRVSEDSCRTAEYMQLHLTR